MDSELERFEAELAKLSPGSLPEGLIARMEAAMEGWEAAPPQEVGESGKVVPFPKLEEEAEVGEFEPEVIGRKKEDEEASE